MALTWRRRRRISLPKKCPSSFSLSVLSICCYFFKMGSLFVCLFDVWWCRINKWIIKSSLSSLLRNKWDSSLYFEIFKWVGFSLNESCFFYRCCLNVVVYYLSEWMIFILSLFKNVLRHAHDHGVVFFFNSWSLASLFFL